MVKDTEQMKESFLQIRISNIVLCNCELDVIKLDPLANSKFNQPTNDV